MNEKLAIHGELRWLADGRSDGVHNFEQFAFDTRPKTRVRSSSSARTVLLDGGAGKEVLEQLSFLSYVRAGSRGIEQTSATWNGGFEPSIAGWYACRLGVGLDPLTGPAENAQPFAALANYSDWMLEASFLQIRVARLCCYIPGWGEE
jgi:hypothetical protein